MSTQTMPSADVVFDTLFAYQRSAALKSAIDLEVFTAIDDGAHTTSAIAKRCGASERGTRILCDFLSVLGLLNKSGSTYQLVPESATFLSKRSPAYLGTTARFLLRPELKRNFDDLTEAVRRGGVPTEGDNAVADENPYLAANSGEIQPYHAGRHAERRRVHVRRAASTTRSRRVQQRLGARAADTRDDPAGASRTLIGSR